MDRRFTPPKRVTSPTWGSPPPCKQALSLRNRTAERRGQQNACVWQTWQAYYLRVLWWSSLKLMFPGLLQKVLLKGGWSSAEKSSWQNYCHACHTRFAVFFPLPSCCVSSIMLVPDSIVLTIPISKFQDSDQLFHKFLTVRNLCLTNYMS